MSRANGPRTWKEENVNGCYAQKPLLSFERIINASSRAGDVVLDSFAHSGTSLLAADRLGRKCFTMDADPIFCEIAIRRLERFRSTGRTGWQGGHAFESEEASDVRLASVLRSTLEGTADQADLPVSDLLTLAE